MEYDDLFENEYESTSEMGESSASNTIKSNDTVGKNLGELSRVDLISALDKIRDVLLTSGSKVDELDKIDTEIANAKNKEKDILTEFSEPEKKKVKVTAIISFVVSFVIGFLLFQSLLGVFLFSIIVTLIASFAIYRSIMSRVETDPHPEHVEKARNYHIMEVEPLEKRREYISSGLSQWFSSDLVLWATTSLNENYLDYSILSTFISYLKSGRADNLKEVLNLYEEELHRGRMEDMQQKTMNAAERTANSAAQTAKSAAQAEKAARSSAASNAATAANIRAIRKKINRL